MNSPEDRMTGQSYLSDNISKSVEYCAREYEMTWSEVIGCLQLMVHYYSTIAYSQTMASMEEEENEDDNFGSDFMM